MNLVMRFTVKPLGFRSVKIAVLPCGTMILQTILRRDCFKEQPEFEEELDYE